MLEHEEVCPDCEEGTVFMADDGDSGCCVSGKCDECGAEFYALKEGDGWSRMKGV